MVDLGPSISDFLKTHFEWLAVFDGERSLALRTDETAVEQNAGKTNLGFYDDGGFTFWRVHSFEPDGAEAELHVSRNFGMDKRVLRLVPRTSAAELTREIRTARLIRANQIAADVATFAPSITITRVALNEPDGRLARIMAGTRRGIEDLAITADVTSTIRPEAVLAAALKWFHELNRRRSKPVERMWVVAPSRQMSGVRRLHALLSPQARAWVTLLEIKRSGISVLDEWPLAALWRRKPKALSIPSEVIASRTAAAILAIDPERIDVLRTRGGETLRFLGLPFARVRKLMGSERAWFGVGRQLRELTPDSRAQMATLIDELADIRRADSGYQRHLYFRSAAEHWLESMLKRNITALDGNLILSPIYNQFRFSAEKIDLLAIRRDGRLVVIELKTAPDRDMVFQAADYWQKIELQRRHGILAAARLFGDRKILDEPPLVYTVAPALSFHHDYEFFASKLHPDIELWRFELQQDWRSGIRVIGRKRIGQTGPATS